MAITRSLAKISAARPPDQLGDPATRVLAEAGAAGEAGGVGSEIARA